MRLVFKGLACVLHRGLRQGFFAQGTSSGVLCIGDLVRVLYISVFILLVNGCVNPFNPLMDNNRGSYIGLPNTTPYNVLRNLETAYNQKNLDLYISTLDKDFHFQANPDVEPVIGVTWWGYDVEIEFHRNLFSRGNSNRSLPVPNIITLSLTIPPDTEWFEDRQVGHEGWVIIRSGFYLRLSFSGQPDLTASGFAQFHMKPVGNRWYIGKWVDMSN